MEAMRHKASFEQIMSNDLRCTLQRVGSCLQCPTAEVAQLMLGVLLITVVILTVPVLVWGQGP